MPPSVKGVIGTSDLKAKDEQGRIKLEGYGDNFLSNVEGFAAFAVKKISYIWSYNRQHVEVVASFVCIATNEASGYILGTEYSTVTFYNDDKNKGMQQRALARILQAVLCKDEVILEGSLLPDYTGMPEEEADRTGWRQEMDIAENVGNIITIKTTMKEVNGEKYGNSHYNRLFNKANNGPWNLRDNGWQNTLRALKLVDIYTLLGGLFKEVSEEEIEDMPLA